MIKLSIILASIFSLIFSERGDLLSFEYKDSKDIDSIQEQLDSQFGESLSPDALFDIHMYSITYETIDQFGNETIASGLVAYPIAIENAFPIMSFQHGTQIRRESAPSMGGFNELIMWLTTSGYIFVDVKVKPTNSTIEAIHLTHQVISPFGVILFTMFMLTFRLPLRY